MENKETQIFRSRFPISIGDLAKRLKEAGYETGQKRLFKYLRGNGYLVKEGCMRNQPTKKSRELGLFETTTCAVVLPYGQTLTKTTTAVTARGLLYFINKLTKGGLS